MVKLFNVAGKGYLLLQEVWGSIYLPTVNHWEKHDQVSKSLGMALIHCEDGVSDD